MVLRGNCCRHRCRECFLHRKTWPSLRRPRRFEMAVSRGCRVSCAKAFAIARREWPESHNSNRTAWHHPVRHGKRSTQDSIESTITAKVREQIQDLENLPGTPPSAHLVHCYRLLVCRLLMLAADSQARMGWTRRNAEVYTCSAHDWTLMLTEQRRSGLPLA